MHFLKELFVEYFLKKLHYYAIGAYVSSYVGYRLNYNLYDWTKDHILALFGRKG